MLNRDGSKSITATSSELYVFGKAELQIDLLGNPRKSKVSVFFWICVFGETRFNLGLPSKSICNSAFPKTYNSDDVAAIDSFLKNDSVLKMLEFFRQSLEYQPRYCTANAWSNNGFDFQKNFYKMGIICLFDSCRCVTSRERPKSAPRIKNKSAPGDVASGSLVEKRFSDNPKKSL